MIVESRYDQNKEIQIERTFRNTAALHNLYMGNCQHVLHFRSSKIRLVPEYKSLSNKILYSESLTLAQDIDACSDCMFILCPLLTMFSVHAILEGRKQFDYSQNRPTHTNFWTITANSFNIYDKFLKCLCTNPNISDESTLLRARILA